MEILRSFQAWRGYRKAVKHLEALSDRELDDLGVARNEIRNLVRRR